MKDIVWIVSYPRSGNTFLRALLSNYFSDAGRPLTLAEIGATTIGEHDEQLWTALTGQAPADRTIEAQWRNRLAYIEKRRERAGPEQRFFKAHTLNSTAYGVPGFAFTPGDRILHVVRHPCDVALSCAAYWGIDQDKAVQRLLNPGLVVNGKPNHGYEVLGSWEQHTRSWLGASTPPVHRIRYFDLAEDTLETLRGIIAFLGHEPNPYRLKAAVAFASFDTLSAQEGMFGFVEGQQPQGGQFFRVGKALQWPGKLEPEQVRALTEPVQDILDDLGFSAFVAQRLAGAA